MNPLETLMTGIEPEHAAALAAGLVAALFLPFLRPAGRADGGRDVKARWATALLGVASAVHLALPLGHRSGVGLTIGYLASGAAYGLLAFAAHTGRAWRLGTALLVPANLLGYLIVVGRGGEEADQVGIASGLVELVAFGLAILAARGRVRRAFAAIGTSLAVFLFGAVVWVATFEAHHAADTEVEGASTPAVGHTDHDHQHLARAQAGVIMRQWAGDHEATVPEAAAADRLASATKLGVRRYATLTDALAAGYKWPLGRHTGMDVHLEQPDFKKDGRVLDPERPEMLVFAIDGEQASLLGVVFVMEEAGRPGPQPGGPITSWHAHNLCVSLIPPGIGIVTPFGGCPAFSLTLTTSEMMHVWVVDNPAGPYADGVDKDWAAEYLAQHGLPLDSSGGSGS